MFHVEHFFFTFKFFIMAKKVMPKFHIVRAAPEGDFFRALHMETPESKELSIVFDKHVAVVFDNTDFSLQAMNAVLNVFERNDVLYEVIHF